MSELSDVESKGEVRGGACVCGVGQLCIGVIMFHERISVFYKAECFALGYNLHMYVRCWILNTADAV